jgi:hypothetical protein
MSSKINFTANVFKNFELNQKGLLIEVLLKWITQ